MGWGPAAPATNPPSHLHTGVWQGSPLKLLMHEVRFAASLARLTAGSKRAARMAMMAMTASSSISVKARFEFILSKIPQSCNPYLAVSPRCETLGRRLRVVQYGPTGCFRLG